MIFWRSQSINDKEGVLVTQQILIHCKNGQMEHGHTVSEYNIKEHGAVYVVIRLIAGQETYFLPPEKLLAPRYNFVYPGIGQNSRSFSWGNQSFTRSCGWKKMALKVLGEYDDVECLGVSRYDEIDSADKEWPVSYHGTQKRFAKAIAEERYALEKGKRFL